MSYVLHAVVGDFDRLRSLSAGLPRAVVAPLRQRFGLLPVTGEIFDGLGGGRRQVEEPFVFMSPGLAELLADWSRGGPVAYVEADFFGGSGDQAAALWEDGRRTWGPVNAWITAGPAEKWPTNAVLARLGAIPAGEFDLFDTVGFGRERDMEGWREAGLRALDAADYDAWEAARRARDEAAAREAAERDRYVRRADVPVVLDGKAVMEVLGIPPSRLVGAAVRHLQEVHLERGPLTPDEAAAELRRWAARTL
ncbi:hypothetical protein [Spirillospora sp. NPDC029432]|uniref:hypothetical protein n=1 Tax=Spirillospora sp. NPDC029432 TaxID=3154599 RepID=UPI003451946C